MSFMSENYIRNLKDIDKNSLSNIEKINLTCLIKSKEYEKPRYLIRKIDLILNIFRKHVDDDIEIELMNYAYCDFSSIIRFKKDGQHVDVFYVNFDENIGVDIIFDIGSKDLLKYVDDKIDKFFDYLRLKSGKDEESKINLLVQRSNNLQLTEQVINFDKKGFNLEKTYNTDFVENYELLLNHLKENKSGLHMLYGIPGCGKTTLIRHICGLDIGKKIIYISPDNINFLSQPGFVQFMLNTGKNSVLIVEDSENVICNGGNTNAISNIRNLTDGIVGDILNIQIIATFNGVKDNIDEALLRPGRLLTENEIKPLEADKANVLLSELGKEAVTEAIRIADIYNNVEGMEIVKRKKVGFGN